jgi:hypothetical protein
VAANLTLWLIVRPGRLRAAEPVAPERVMVAVH